MLLILAFNHGVAYSGSTKELPSYLHQLTQSLPAWANPQHLYFEQTLKVKRPNKEGARCFAINGKRIHLYQECTDQDQTKLGRGLISKVFSHSHNKIKKKLLDLTNGEELALVNYFEIPGTFEFISSLKHNEELLTAFHREALLFQLYSKNSESHHPHLIYYLDALNTLADSDRPKKNQEVEIPAGMQKISNIESQTDYRYLRDHTDSLAARIKLIKEAKKRIWMSYYIWSSDTIGTYFIGLIAEKLKENPKLDVRILVDGKGWNSGESPLVADKKQLFKYLASLGAKIKVYNPYSNLFHVGATGGKGGHGYGRKRVANIVSCNHDKITLVDDDLMIVGGRNIANEYFLSEQDIIDFGTYGYYDSDILMRSKGLANRLEVAFLSEYTSYVSIPLKIQSYNKDKSSMQAMALAKKQVEVKIAVGEFEWDELDVTAQILDKNGQTGEDQSFSKIIVNEIENAQQEIMIQNPYVVLTDELYSALDKAGSKQDMSIILELPFHDAIQFKALQNYIERNYQKLLHDIPGMEIYARRGPVQLHSKIMVFDGKKTLVSSFNLDPLSFYYNSEVGVLINSTALAERVRNEILQDLIPEASVAYELDGPQTLTRLDKRLVKKVKSQGFLYWLIKDYL